MVFDIDQVKIGFETWEFSPGNLKFSFYRRDCSLLDHLVVPVTTEIWDTPGSLAFESIDGIPEIAAVTIEWDTSYGGPGFRAIWVQNSAHTSDLDSDGDADGRDLGMFCYYYAMDDNRADLSGDQCIDEMDIVKFAERYGSALVERE